MSIVQVINMHALRPTTTTDMHIHEYACFKTAVPKLFGLRTPFAVKYFSWTLWRPGQY